MAGGCAYTLHMWEEGTGQPVLFLHALGASGRYWRGRLGPISGHHRCLLPDLLGFGHSPKPNGAYTIDDHLAAVRATLAARGAADAPLVIVGHSLGAILAAEYAARSAAQVRGLVLLGLPLFRNATEAREYIGEHGSWMARLTVANGRAAHAVHAVHAVMHPLLIPLAAAFATVTRAVPPDIAVDSMYHTWASYSRTLDRCILHHDPTPALAALGHIPILMLHGSNDSSAPVARVAALAARMANVTLRTFPGGHQLFLKQHDACVEAIASFARGVR
jgi:pimeloyl-ACP methyl ester carboxylesterase